MITKPHTSLANAAVLVAAGLLLALATLLCQPTLIMAAGDDSPTEPISTTITFEPRGALRLKAVFGGALTAVALTDDYAFVGEGPTLIVLAFSADAQPAQVGEVLPLGGVISDIELIETPTRRLAAVTLGTAGLVTLDLTDPTAPVMLGRISNIGNAQKLSRGPAIEGNGMGWLYVEDRGAGVRAVDGRDPGAPVDQGVILPWWASERQHDMAVDGNRLYVVAASYFSGDLRSYDVSDPLRPVPVTMIGGEGLRGVGDIALAKAGAETYLYAGNRIFEGSTLRQARGVSDLGTDKWLIQGARGYTLYDGQLMVYDLTKLDDPIFVGAYPIGSGGYMSAQAVVAARGNWVAVVEASGVIQVLDLTGFDILRQVGAVALRSVDDIAISGSLALTINWGYGTDQYLRIFDATEPAQLRQLSALRVDAQQRLSVAGSYALLSSDHTLTTVNFEDPSAPFVAASATGDPFKRPGQYLDPRDATIYEGKTYVAAGGGLVIEAVPDAPDGVATLALPKPAQALEVRGMMVDGKRGLWFMSAQARRCILLMPRIAAHRLFLPQCPLAAR